MQCIDKKALIVFFNSLCFYGLRHRSPLNVFDIMIFYLSLSFCLLFYNFYLMILSVKYFPETYSLTFLMILIYSYFLMTLKSTL